MLPVFAFFTALGSIIAYFIGFPSASIPFAVLTVLVAIFGILFPDEKRAASGRVACGVAVLMAATPFAAPFVQAQRYKILERQRAAETRDKYAAIDEAVERIAPIIERYYAQHRFYPDVEGDALLSRVTPNGLQTPPSMEGLSAPTDPFSPNAASMRWCAVRDHGVLLASVGQDRANQLPLPGVMMDPPPAHYLAAWAQLGVNPRTQMYDPTNGALGMGDVVRFVGKSDLDGALAPLDEAWDSAERKSPYRPTKRKRATEPDPDPQSVRDAEGAADLYAEGRYLAAAALASRSVQERHPYPAQWKDADLGADLTRGMALYQLGAFRAAADALIDYTESVPNDAMAHYYLAAALYKGGRLQDAQIHIAAAAQIDQNAAIAQQAYRAQQALERGGTPGFPEPAGGKRGIESGE